MLFLHNSTYLFSLISLLFSTHDFLKASFLAISFFYFIFSPQISSFKPMPSTVSFMETIHRSMFLAYLSFLSSRLICSVAYSTSLLEFLGEFQCSIYANLNSCISSYRILLLVILAQWSITILHIETWQSALTSSYPFKSTRISTAFYLSPFLFYHYHCSSLTADYHLSWDHGSSLLTSLPMSVPTPFHFFLIFQPEWSSPKSLPLQTFQRRHMVLRIKIKVFPWSASTGCRDS